MRKFGILLGLLAALAACGGDDTTSDTAPATVADTAPTEDSDATASDIEAAVTTDSGTDDATGDVTVVAVDADPCELVTAADVTAATGLTVVAVDDDPVLPPNGCVFDVGLSAVIFVSVEDGQGRMAGPAALHEGYLAEVEAGKAEEIADLGVSAVYSPSFRGLVVDAGSGQFFAVGLSGGYPDELAEPRELFTTLANIILEQL